MLGSKGLREGKFFQEMEIILGIDRLTRSFISPVVTLGNFDGVHLGHQRIFERVKQEAARNQGEGIVITFEPHPLKFLSPRNCPPLLTSFGTKMILIERSGIKTVLCREFSQTFSMMPAFEFIKDILVEKIKVKKVIVGYNYRFGRGKKGDVHALQEGGKLFDFGVEVMKPLTVGNTIVSSSKIRELIRDGMVEEAAKLLGRNYLISGRVVKGSGRGHTLGFPTANLEISETLYPKTGIYAVDAERNQQVFPGVANIGYNPTFTQAQRGTADKTPLSVEVHILNFDEEIYGQELQIHFRKRIRDEMRFDSATQLVEQIKKDVEWAKQHAFGKTE